MTIFSLLSFVSNDCKKLNDGNYKVEYDPMFEKYPSFSFIIKDHEFILKQHDSISNLKIEWLSNCAFRVIGFTQPKEPLSDFQKGFYSSGKPYYEITKVQNDTTYFIFRKNLHIQIYSGKFIRTKN